MSFSPDQLLIFAARAGNRSLAQDRLAGGANPNYLDPLHGSAAMAAIRRGDADMLGLLLDAGLKPDGPAALDPGGLIEAAFHHQHEHMAVLLADRGFRLLPHARSIYRERLQSVRAERATVEPSAGGNAG
jgi:ankyrin repeat protein